MLKLPFFTRLRGAIGALILCVSSSTASANDHVRQVVVVANSNFEGSETVARAYIERRNIPESHLILLAAPVTEVISRAEFHDTIHNPLLAVLLERGLVEGISREPDSFGRNGIALIHTDLRYAVLCYGMPSRINGVPVEELDDYQLRRDALQPPHQQHIDAFSEGPLAKNESSVDGDLALLLRRDMPLNGFLPNPFFRVNNPSAFHDILKVTRLDGPSAEAVIRMLDNALEGERFGLKGRAYVDEDARGGGFAMGNEWLAQTAEVFTTLGFSLTHDKERTTLPVDGRIDAPVLYAGWYAGNLNAPFNLPGFRFPPGAVAAHLHSFSAAQIRSTSRGWVGPFVERGVSATFGNVAEPYLALTHHFNVFFSALANGWNFADAAYAALPGLSWQAVAIGDPLFRPFATSLEEQINALGPIENLIADQYVILRKAGQLLRKELVEEAAKSLSLAMRASPGPAIALEQARILLQLERPDEARRALSIAPHLTIGGSQDWGLHAEIADTLLQAGDAGNAFAIYRKLEAIRMPKPMRIALLKRGIVAARAANETAIAATWHAEVTPPPPPPPAPASENPPTANP